MSEVSTVANVFMITWSISDPKNKQKLNVSYAAGFSLSICIVSKQFVCVIHPQTSIHKLLLFLPTQQIHCHCYADQTKLSHSNPLLPAQVKPSYSTTAEFLIRGQHQSCASTQTEQVLVFCMCSNLRQGYYRSKQAERLLEKRGWGCSRKGGGEKTHLEINSEIKLVNRKWRN